MEESKTLGQLAERVGGHVIGDSSTAVSDVTHDSRQVGEGSLFVAIRGENFDGHRFVEQAAAEGAAAACVDLAVESPLPLLVVGDTRAALGELASAVHGDPSRRLGVIGVTGTNGKTTVTHYVHSLLTACGVEAGLIGTIGSKVGSDPLPSIRTTPEASDFQRLLATMADRGAEKVAVEVSSHALELGRVRATRFEVAAFTNLSQDHLDFHESMDAYEAAKWKLFSDYEVGTAVFNIDDPVGRKFSSVYGGAQVRVGEDGDIGFGPIHPTPVGSSFELRLGNDAETVETNVIGGFNVSNLITALASCLSVDMDASRLVRALSNISNVPGRFERVDAPSHLPVVVVDYAHGPDAIAEAIATARRLTNGRVIVVVGAGGDRDRGKRRPMGGAASAADLIVVTSDNPRTEDPRTIIDEVMEGVTGEAISIEDRAAAIGHAIQAAGEDDIVLVLGKGHEQGQERGGVVAPFDDREVSRRHLAALENSQAKSTNFGDESGSMAP